MKDLIFVYGPPLVGKTTVGQLLAQALGMPFADLDTIIEAKAGTKITDLFSAHGEQAFRHLETAALQEFVAFHSGVLALGGGALLNQMNRDIVESVGPVCCLGAASGTLYARLHLQDSNLRPLLSDEPDQKLTMLLSKRASHYASFPLQIMTDGKPPQEVLADIQSRLGRFHLPGEGGGSEIRVLDNGLDKISEFLQSISLLPRQVAIVTDENVAPLYAAKVCDSLNAAGIQTNVIQIQSGETHKTLGTVSFLWDEFGRLKLERKDVVLALGGGVVGDLAGFAAATYLRGIPWMVLPTTLLAMVDASIGGKTGFDLPQGKNLVGAFHSPRLVISDLNTLSSLPDLEIKNGLAEIVKHGIIGDPSLFEDCASGENQVRKKMPDILRRAVAVKIKVVQKDPFESSLRAALNFGHTIGHGLEWMSNFNLKHGQAVSIGMAQEALLAEKIGLCEPGLSQRIACVLEGLGLPTQMPAWVETKRLIVAMNMDKKKSDGRIRFALPVKVGEVKIGVEIEHLEKKLAL